MSTTTLRLPDDLKARIARLAKRSGKAPYSIMLEAIAQKVEEEELRASFHAEIGRNRSSPAMQSK